MADSSLDLYQRLSPVSPYISAHAPDICFFEGLVRSYERTTLKVRTDLLSTIRDTLP